jgi:hypothetical protein
MRGNLFMICQQWTAVISCISRFFSVTISEQCDNVMVRYTSEQRVFLYGTCLKYDLLESFDVNFVQEGLLDLCFFNETINCVSHSRPLLFRVNRRRTTLWLLSARLRYSPHCTYMYAGFVLCLRGQDYQQWYLVSTFTQS